MDPPAPVARCCVRLHLRSHWLPPRTRRVDMARLQLSPRARVRKLGLLSPSWTTVFKCARHRRTLRILIA
ncbi:hypothetical protein ACFPRL_28160 [Pseudoclavibacter helvolus]